MHVCVREIMNMTKLFLWFHIVCGEIKFYVQRNLTLINAMFQFDVNIISTMVLVYTNNVRSKGGSSFLER